LLRRIPASPLRGWQWALLALGLTQVPAIAALVVVGWFFVLAWRGRYKPEGVWAHNFLQLGLAAWTAMALAALYEAVQQGLLFRPDMQVAGSGSGDTYLRWYADRTAGGLLEAGIVSAPLWVWKVAMLLWSLWLATSLVRWLPWAWRSYSSGGLWKRRPRAPKGALASAPAGQGQPAGDPPAQ
jgi:hypothetical protein